MFAVGKDFTFDFDLFNQELQENVFSLLCVVTY